MINKYTNIYKYINEIVLVCKFLIVRTNGVVHAMIMINSN